MKRNLLCILVFLLIITGCGKKEKKIEEQTLTCEKSDLISENEVKQRVVSKYVDNKIESTNLEISVNVLEKYVPYIDMLEEELMESYRNYQNKDGITFNVTKTENTINLSIKVNYNALNVLDTEEIGFTNDESTYDDAKQSLTENGYFCS